MSDPAIEAAKRSWLKPRGRWAAPYFNPDNRLEQCLTDAAREALAPLRELHRRTRLFELAVYPFCEDAGHDIFEDSDGQWCCRQCTDLRAAHDGEEYICAHCADLDSNSEWPCATAELIYSSEELAQ